MIAKGLSEINAAELDALVVARVEEGVSLDFKQALVGGTRDDTKEFVADVCAFANALGGDLVYGIRENAAGEADGVVPLTFVPDDEILRLENTIADRIEPKLFGVRMRAVPYPGGHVLVVRVPQSIQGIHRSKADQHFYVRESRSKRQLDIAGIVTRIEGRLTRRTRLEEALAGRHAAVLTNNLPVPLQPGAKMVVLVFPGLQGTGDEAIEISGASHVGDIPVPTNPMGLDLRMCYEGALHHSAIVEGALRAYTLVHHVGVVEGVWGLRGVGGDRPSIAAEYAEGTLLQYVNKLIPRMLATLPITLPLIVRPAIVGGNGSTVLTQNRDVAFHYNGDVLSPIRSSVLLLPEVTVSDWPVADLPELFRPSVDRLWQSAGYPRSFQFQARGGRMVWTGEL